MWAITRAINQYDQDGDYLVCVFKDKPDFAKIKTSFPKETDEFIGRLTRGGGRKDSEHCWYYLTELKDGEEYKSYQVMKKLIERIKEEWRDIVSKIDRQIEI